MTRLDHDTRQPATHLPSRIAALDIARGIAILGTLGTNIWIFSHPAGFLGYLSRPTSAVDGWQPDLERLLMALANGKFLGLLTLMFGIGLAIQQSSAVRRGHAWPGSYPWRALLLFLDGVLHYFLVVEFDVLMGYAVTGLVVAWIIAGTPRTQRRWIVITAAIHTVLILALTALLLGSGPSGPYTGPNPYGDGSWFDLVRLRWQLIGLFRLEPVLILLMGIALFTIGARLLAAGVFERRGSALRHRLIMVGSSALVLDLLLAMTVPDTILISRYLLAPIVAMGLLALIAAGWLDRAPGPIGRRLAEVGRMALTCYITQNLLAAILFQGWGLGLSQVPAEARTWVTLAAFAALCVVMVTGAHLWLRRFDRGPVEWAWARGYALLARR